MVAHSNVQCKEVMSLFSLHHACPALQVATQRGATSSSAPQVGAAAGDNPAAASTQACASLQVPEPHLTGDELETAYAAALGEKVVDAFDSKLHRAYYRYALCQEWRAGCEALPAQFQGCTKPHHRCRVVSAVPVTPSSALPLLPACWSGGYTAECLALMKRTVMAAVV